jgi:hypothetical protein
VVAPDRAAHAAVAMTIDRRPVLADVLDALAVEAHIDADWRTRLGEPGDAAADQPWYLRAMVGLGAWLASLLLIGFVGGLGLVNGTLGFVAVGSIAILAAVVLRRRWGGAFSSQLALAASLAGQGLVAFGIASFGRVGEVEAALLTLLGLNVVLFVVYPDPIHRSLSVLVIVGSKVALLYLWELAAVVPLVGPALAVVFVAALETEASWIGGPRGELGSALVAGTMIGAFGCLALSTVYVLPELAASLSLYPRPWLSSLVLGPLLLWVSRPIVRTAFSGSPLRARLAYLSVGAVVIAAAQAPGLILALVAAAAGLVAGRRAIAIGGCAACVFFLATFFYGIEVGMLAKAAALVVSGAVVLAGRLLWVEAAASRRRSVANA